MASMDPLVVAVLVLALLVALAAFFRQRNNRSHRLEDRFGPEYRRALDEHGSRKKAEAELRDRMERVSRFRIVPLAREDAERFAERWKVMQARFVDDPKDAVADADRLVCQLMQARGYPMGDFDRQAADLSVDHPKVVEHYRTAHEIVTRSERGEADTEALRRAVVHYRALFHDLLEADDARVAEPAMPARPQEAR